MQEQSDPSLKPFPPLFPATWNAQNHWTPSSPHYWSPWFHAQTPVLFSATLTCWGFFISPGASAQRSVQNNSTTLYYYAVQHTSIAEITFSMEPHGKKMLLESDIKIVLQTRTWKRKPPKRMSCMEIWRVQQIPENQTESNYFAESQMTSGGKRWDMSQGIYFTRRVMWRCLTENMSYKGSMNFRPILLHGSPKSLLFSVFKM